MNSSQNTPSSTLEQHKDNDETDLLALLDTILDAKWLIAGITILCTALALAYAMFSTPIYQANTMIQVEQNQGNNNPVMGELALLFDTGSPVAAEIEILRSRMVIGETVDRLQLHNRATPDYVPIIGPWLAKRASGLSEPGFLGFGNYVSGKERISLGQLDVPSELQGQELKLISTETGYDLFTEDSELILSGKVDETHEFHYHGESGRIHITELYANPGASFTVISGSRQGSISSLQRQLNVSEKGKQSGILTVSLEGADRHHITQILNTLGHVYVQQNIDRKAAEADKSLSFLDAFLPE
ncbi:MAG: tyrosine protein kinase, partial [Oligella ureolytica]|nr:tyrosine protein kinase [Oligella ureolytica]